MWKGMGVPDLFALKTGTLRGVVELVEPLIEIRFRKVRVPELQVPWFISLSKDSREYMVVFPNDLKGESIDPSADGYEVLLYLIRSPREEKITRLISTETRFRFVRPSDRLMTFADAILEKLPGHSPPQ
jgi:hypothetical protein